MMEVRCHAIDKRNLGCGKYLGRIQIEGTNRYSDYTCGRCGATTQLFIDEVGVLHRDTMIRNIKLEAAIEPVYVGSAP